MRFYLWFCNYFACYICVSKKIINLPISIFLLYSKHFYNILKFKLKNVYLTDIFGFFFTLICLVLLLYNKKLARIENE